MGNSPKRILISRTDSIGDVMLTLPLAAALKQSFPECEVLFLGTLYTKPVIECCSNIAQFIDWNAIKKLSKKEAVAFFTQLNIDVIIHVFPNKQIASYAQAAGIPLRIGTSRRIYHWFTCNKTVYLKRKNSTLHESQLNLQLLKGLAIKCDYSLKEIEDMYSFKTALSLDERWIKLLDNTKRKIILHPKSKGSAREWGIENFKNLIALLPSQYYQIFISGTEQEGRQLQEIFNLFPEVIDLTGKLSLSQFITFISKSDILLAASTGPLHIAAALGKHAIGIYPPIKPMHPQRWGPVGKKASTITINKNCNKCRKTGICACIKNIEVEKVLGIIKKNI